MTGWKKPKPHGAGPYGWWPDRPKPEWMRHDGGNLPAVGPDGRSPTSPMHMDARETAYRNMVHRLSNRWRDHRRAFVPGGGT